MGIARHHLSRSRSALTQQGPGIYPGPAILGGDENNGLYVSRLQNLQSNVV